LSIKKGGEKVFLTIHEALEETQAFFIFQEGKGAARIHGSSRINEKKKTKKKKLPSIPYLLLPKKGGRKYSQTLTMKGEEEGPGRRPGWINPSRIMGVFLISFLGGKGVNRPREEKKDSQKAAKKKREEVW